MFAHTIIEAKLLADEYFDIESLKDKESRQEHADGSNDIGRLDRVSLRVVKVDDIARRRRYRHEHAVDLSHLKVRSVR